MIGSVLLVGVLACGALGAPRNEARIIGGTAAKLGEVPYIVSLQFDDDHSCGASILSSNFILSAAHCLDGRQGNPKPMYIKYGILDRLDPNNKIQVDKWKIHENFTMRGNIPNDIAILKLKEHIPFSENVQPIKLPTADPVVEGESIEATLSGWGDNGGSQYPRGLLTTQLPLFSDTACTDILYTMYDPAFHICAGSLDGQHKQCTGDSGGPLYAEGVQHGVVSWSYKPCDITGYPGVFTRVYHFLDWIDRAMNEM